MHPLSMLDPPAAVLDEDLTPVPEGDSYTELNLMDMPDEILTKILTNLAPETLHYCTLAHSRLREITLSKFFKNRYIQTQLHLLDEEGLKYDVLPKSFSRLSVLWYLTNASTIQRYAARCDYYRPVLGRSYKFFTLAVFKFLFQIWLIQAGCEKIANAGRRKGGNYSNPLNIPARREGIKSCDSALEDCLHVLPKYLTEFLTKLLIVVPDILKKSMFMKHVCIRKGEPAVMAFVKQFLTDLKTKTRLLDFKFQFALEFVSGEPVGEDLHNGMLLLFSRDVCVLWIGFVTAFPRCLHMGTNALRMINTNLSFNALKECLSDIEWALEKALSKE